MAKMFYTLDEAKTALGKSEDEIKQFSRDGRLREFRDGPRLMFKSDQVEALKAQLGGGGVGPVDLGPSDSGAPIGLVDSRGGSASGLSLADSVGSGIAGSGLAGMSSSGSIGSGMMNLKEDTALAADLGLSGTMGGMPSPAQGSGSGLSGSAGGRGSVNVFGDDEHADPMAQTAISSSPSMADLNLEGVGSGSGLLDLTRESDDTSLGADLLDDISSPASKNRPSSPGDTGAVSTSTLAAPRGGVVRGTVGVTYVEAVDPTAEGFGWLALGTAIITVFGIFALLSAVFGATSDWVGFFQTKAFFITLAILAAIPVIFFVFGLLVGKSRSR